MNTYTTKDINGNEVELPWISAKDIAEAYDRKCYKEDILVKLEALCEDEELDMDKISPATIDAIVDEYKDSRESDESWSYHADNAIDSFIDDIREDCRAADKNKPLERE